MKRFHSFFILVTLTLLVGCAPESTATDKVWLFNGKDLSGWREPKGRWGVADSVSLNPTNRHMFLVKAGDGIFVNGNTVKDVNLKSVYEHGDCEAHIEFNVSEKSNSGVYFQGRYEIQILDSFGVEKPKHGDCGGLYQRWKDEKGYDGRAPRLNASKPAGQWQTLDVVFRAPRFDASGQKVENARFVKVLLNGKLIHENQEATGPTRSPAFNDEKPTGFIMLQGDHGPIAFRKMWLRPLDLK